MTRAWVLAAVALGCAATGLGLSSDAARTLPGQGPPRDARLGAPHDLDHPAAFAPAYADRAGWERRASELREQVKVALGLWPMPERTPLRPVIHGKIERDGYTVEKVYFASLPGHYVTGNLYRPRPEVRTGLVDGKRPGMLSPHGHWPQGRFSAVSDSDARKAIASGAEKTVEGARFPLQARQAMLARMGFVVFQWDMVGLADSTKIPHRAGFTSVDAELRLQSAMGLQTWNSVRALDFLSGLPDVDPARIAVSGESGGGTQTFILGAVDERPRVAFPVVMVSTGMQGGCVCENASLLRVGTNNVELAALFAPRPLGMAAADDWTREIESKGLPELRAIWGLYGAAGDVVAKHFAFPHNYNQVSREMMYGFVNRHLGLGLPEPVTERPFDPVPPAELSVFDAAHPRPADEVDAAGVRRWMTGAAERQLAALAARPDEYRRVVGAALRAMVGDRLPDAADVVAQPVREVPGEGVTARHVLLGRRGAGEQVPALRLTPARADGTVVVWAHPDGKASLFTGDQLAPDARRLLARGVTIVAPDLFLTGDFQSPGRRVERPRPEQKAHRDLPFAGFDHGYNRSLLADRVHDLLTTIAWSRTGAARVRLAGVERAGVWALVARALADGAIDRAALDADGFDFDQVRTLDDEMMLPGALRYGGVGGLVPLLASGETAVFDLPPSARVRAAAGPGTTLVPGAARAGDLVSWLLR